jgi:hypothetical protein
VTVPAPEIPARTSWIVHWGRVHGLSGIDGQVPKCGHNRTLFYLPENVAFDHFPMSSGERQGLKAGRLGHRHPQALELLAPATLWRQLAGLVHLAGRLDRPVRHNRRFTWSWVESLPATRILVLLSESKPCASSK